MTIPKIVHLTCKTGKPPTTYLPIIESFQKLHPDWEIKIYSDDACRMIIANDLPSLLAVYDFFTYPVQRADLFRVVVVYLFGGFYADMDVQFLKNIDSLCKFNVVLAEEKTLLDDEAKKLGHQYTLRVANYMFGGVAGHPFWAALLTAIVLKSSNPVLFEDDILENTGPGLFTNVYHEMKGYYPDLILLKNKDRDCIKGCRKASCHFGNYAAHAHMGSWRWEQKTSSKQNIFLNRTTKVEFKSVIHELADKLAKTFERLNRPLILETYPQHELPYDGLTGVFNEVKEIGKIVGDTRRIGSADILVCGIPTLYLRNMSVLNNNVVFTTFESDLLPRDWVRAINKYKFCIVPHAAIKMVFENSGVKIPVSVIHQGFNRFNRDFKRTPPPLQDFNVGFLGVPVNRKNLHKLYDACKQLQRTTIPQIKLAVHVASFYNWADEKPFKNIKDDSMVIWSTGKYDSAQISDWYNNLSCYVFPSSGEGWSYTPRESLYLQIPTIISDIPVHRELIESGFCKAIKVAGTEPANFNGRIHGKWAKIETNDIADAIADVYSNYAHYHELAKKGASWIEDKWLNEDMRLQLTKHFISAGGRQV